MERQTIAATPNGQTNTARTGPILTVEDPRLDVNDEKGVMQKRRKVLAVLARWFPMASHGVGQPAPNDQGNFKSFNGLYVGKNSCSTINNFIMKDGDPKKGGTLTAGANNQSWGFAAQSHPGWVAYKPGLGLLPSVGDTFLLFNDEKGLMYHSGIVCQVSLKPGKFWITADSGQQHDGFPGEAAYLQTRRFVCKNPGTEDEKPTLYHYWDPGGIHEYNDIGLPRRLVGWIDLGHPEVVFRSDGEYGPEGTKEDYEDFKRRIRRVDELTMHWEKYRKLHNPEDL